MMAKMFYTLEETKSALGKSEDEVRQFHLRRLFRQGVLPGERRGRRILFRSADLPKKPKSERAQSFGRGPVQADFQQVRSFPKFLPLLPPRYPPTQRGGFLRAERLRSARDP